MNTTAALILGLLTLTGCSNEPVYPSNEDRAYKSVVTMYSGSNDIQSYNKSDVVSDIKEVCSNLKTYEYRSDAVTAADLVMEDVSYELALADGAQSLCPEDWSRAKKKE